MKLTEIKYKIKELIELLESDGDRIGDDTGVRRCLVQLHRLLEEL